jgi:lipopolysaccharide exporter
VTVAAFSRVRHERAQLKERVSTMMSALLAVAFPANALIVALAAPLIGVLYGPRWAPAAAALALTAIYGALRVPVDLLFNVAVAEGRTRSMFVLQIVYLAVLTPVTVVCVHLWGIVGAGIAHVVAIGAVLLPGLVLSLARPTGFGFRQLAITVVRPLAASTVSAFAAYFVASRIDADLPALVAGGVVGLLLYGALTVAWGRRVAVAVRRVWSEGGQRTAVTPEGAHA